jgi:CBS domain-containing protein
MAQWRVRDVMTTDVVTSPDDAAFRTVVELLSAQDVSAVPITDRSGRVVGVVSEADLLQKFESGQTGDRPGGSFRRGRDPDKTAATRASELMSSPALTVGADASLQDAAALMTAEHVKRLLVVDDDDRLIGIVSRADLLRAYNRSDDAVHRDVLDVLRTKLWIDPKRVSAKVQDGVVTLAGTVGRRSTAAIAVRMVNNVPGVVAVVDRLSYGYDDTTLVRSRVHRTRPFSAEPFPPS